MTNRRGGNFNRIDHPYTHMYQTRKKNLRDEDYIPRTSRRAVLLIRELHVNLESRPMRELERARESLRGYPRVSI